MKRTAQDILNFVEDNDVKFAKLTFCDIFGNQKNVSLFASELPRTCLLYTSDAADEL